VFCWRLGWRCHCSGICWLRHRVARTGAFKKMGFIPENQSHIRQKHVENVVPKYGRFIVRFTTRL
jgi:hypothetical protein